MSSFLLNSIRFWEKNSLYPSTIVGNRCGYWLYWSKHHRYWINKIYIIYDINAQWFFVQTPGASPTSNSNFYWYNKLDGQVERDFNLIDRNIFYPRRKYRFNCNWRWNNGENKADTNRDTIILVSFHEAADTNGFSWRGCVHWLH